MDEHNPKRSLVQNNAEIDAQMMHAALNGLSTVMRLGSSYVMGHLELDDGNPELCFVVDRVSALMNEDPIGQTVRLEYWHGNISSSFDSRIVARVENKIRLELPQVVEHSDRRLVPRAVVDGRDGFRFSLGENDPSQSMVLVDLSNTGLAFRCPVGTDLMPGMLQVGWLGLPGHDLVPVELEIRNCRKLGAEVWVGARMMSLKRADRKSITQCIIEIRGPQAG